MGIQLKKSNGELLYPLVNGSDITWDSDVQFGSHAIYGTGDCGSIAEPFNQMVAKKIVAKDSLMATCINSFDRGKYDPFTLYITKDYSYENFKMEPHHWSEFFKEFIKEVGSDLRRIHQPRAICLGACAPGSSCFVIGCITHAEDLNTDGLPNYTEFMAMGYGATSLSYFGTSGDTYYYRESFS